MKKNKLITGLLILGFFLTFNSCNWNKPNEEEVNQIETVDNEISDEIIDELTKEYGITSIDKTVDYDHSITYSFSFPKDINVTIIRIGVVAIFNKLGYDISAIWEIDVDGTHFTEHIYKNVKLTLRIDPQTNMFCLKISKK